MNGVRRYNRKEWSEFNPVLGDGKVGLDTTTNQIKIGDGKTPWVDLPFINPRLVGRDVLIDGGTP